MNSNVPNNVCIWCLVAAPQSADVEHIIPEAVGCPPEFVLTSSVVCKMCNNGLSHLDQAVIDDLDFLLFTSGVPRKKGKPPIVRSRGNVIGTIEGGEARLSFNMESTPREAHNGELLSGYRGRQRDIKANLSKSENGITRLSFEVPFGGNPKFVRGLVKIAFSSLAYFRGADLARSSQFQAIREFVRYGTGSRHVFVVNGGEQPFSNRVWAPFVNAAGEYSVTLRLGIMEFLVDLSPAESQFPQFYSQAKELYADGSWCVLPIV